MQCICRLEGEHWLIRRFLDHLDSVLADAAIVGPWRPEIEMAAEFIEEFIAAYHNAREELVLFPFLVERGLDADSHGRPLTHDHRAFHVLHTALRDSLARDGVPQLEKALTPLHDLAQLLDDHLTEERRFHAALHRRMTEEDEQELARRLRDSFPRADETVERVHALLTRFGAPVLDPPALSA